MQPVNCSNISLPIQVLPEYTAASAVLGLCFALGVPGNIAVLVALLWYVRADHFTPRLMMSLAVSDLLTLLPLPVWIWALLNGWVFGSVACKIFCYVIYWCLYSSILCVTLLSLQRYMQVLHSHKWATLGVRGQNGLLCGTWLVSGVLSSYSLVQRVAGCDQYEIQSCLQLFQSDTEQVATSVWEILVLVICFSTLVYFYVRLHRGVNQSPFFSSNRMTTLLTRIVVVFFIFCSPIPICNVLVIVAVLRKSNSLLIIANQGSEIARAMLFVNSCVNPLLYTFSFRELKRHSPEHVDQVVQIGA
ncbi:apelin receptor B-like [Brachyhypopomus gauderio]|uniref:apelin receptor B-like n=1 Tax=Brachyhypopomus gauderio TaxID=698409 RepID=UPI004041A11B